MARPSRSERYARLFDSLDRATLDPAAWRDVCDALAGLVDATGAVLVPADPESRTVAMPHSAALEEILHRYVMDGWSRRDQIRGERGFAKALQRGFATDLDVISPDEMRRHPYYAEFLASHDLQWFLCLAFRVNGKPWAVSMEGSPKRGPFVLKDIAAVLEIRDRLALAAKAAAALGDRRIEFVKEAFGAERRGLVAIGHGGRIAWLNEPAEEMLRDAELARHGRLRGSDHFVGDRMADLIDAAAGHNWPAGLCLPGPVTAPGREGRAYSIDAIPMPRDFQALLTGVRVLVTIREVAPAATGASDRFAARFSLTPKERELAAHLVAGQSVAAAAAAMRVEISTARQHLKQVFAKTGTHRQAELVALLSRPEP